MLLAKFQLNRQCFYIHFQGQTFENSGLLQLLLNGGSYKQRLKFSQWR